MMFYSFLADCADFTFSIERNDHLGDAKKARYQVVYVGMATQGSIRSRLRLHRRRKHKLWTHFSVYQVWDNVRDDEIAELEGLFRHFYRRDPVASELNKQRGFNPIRQVRRRTFAQWQV